MQRRKARRNRNNKSRFSHIFVSDWLKLKPYQKHTKYDELYTQIANELYELIAPVSAWFEQEVSKSDAKMIALNLSQYFEDIIGELGIWRTFTNMNQDLYGYVLPFYESDEYEIGDINPEDIQFLLWYYYSMIHDVTYAPDVPIFKTQSIKIYNHLNKYEDVLVSDYFESYYTIKDSDNYFDIKTKAAFIITSNYLLNMEATAYFNTQMQEVNEEIQEHMDTGQLLYLLQEEAMYNKNYEINALSVLEWLSHLAVCAEPTREKIRNLSKRVTGEFVFVGKTKQYYLFEHWYTKRPFKVWKESMSPSKEQINIGTVSTMNLVFWDEKWWLSGVMVGGIDEHKRKKESWQSARYSFYANSEEHQKQLLNATALGYETFVKVFGSDVYFAASPEQYVKTQERYIRANMKASQRKNDNSLSDEAIEAYIQRLLEPLPRQADQFQEGVVLIYIENQGITLHPSYAEVVGYLEQEDLDRAGREELYDLLMMDFPSKLTQHFMDRYPMDNLAFPISHSKLDVVKYWKFLHRYHSAGYYSPKTPNMRAANPADIPVTE